MIYLRLFHGRVNPEQEMDDWGTDGPVFGPYLFAHTTYGWDIKLGKPNGGCDELFVHEDMVYYDSIYYGDWSIFDMDVLEKAQFQASVFKQHKAKLSENSYS